MTPDRKVEFTERWTGAREKLYEPRVLPPPPERERSFPERPARADFHNQNYNYILDKRIRVTPIGPWTWHKLGEDRHGREFGFWSGFAERWNRHSKTWSEPQLMHCREFETECDHV